MMFVWHFDNPIFHGRVAALGFFDLLEHRVAIAVESQLFILEDQLAFFADNFESVGIVGSARYPTEFAPAP